MNLINKISFLALVFASTILFIRCSAEEKENQEMNEAKEAPFMWEASTVYFLLTDRFRNGDESNDFNFNRDKETGVLRGFEGGDLRGIIQKIDDNYFSDLGVNAIWMTPIVEQIHDATDEGTGKTYAYHGYWAKDWTSLDPNFGTKEELKELVEKAHAKGIRVLLDAVVNHTGPVTDKDKQWPDEWVRTSPTCTYENFETTVTCTLVDNLPDIRTESDKVVELPEFLIEKWKNEGRYEEEVASLDAFFETTGYPRAPRFYVMKWLSDYITELGIDGYRVDTVKHTEEYVWQEFNAICQTRFSEWKEANPEKVLDENDFYLVGEVYNYAISHEKSFDFGDKQINYFDDAFASLINFEFKWNAMQQTMEEHFSRYSDVLNGSMKGYSVLNYLTSHDDGQPYDASREKGIEAANRLLLSPGGAQIYYGDESNRNLIVEDAVGDATLRTMMNWEEIENNSDVQEVLSHWRKLGKFRQHHPSIGAGIHQKISDSPYAFSRHLKTNNFEDLVVVAFDMEEGSILELPEGFHNKNLRDAYSGETFNLKGDKLKADKAYDLLLLEIIR